MKMKNKMNLNVIYIAKNGALSISNWKSNAATSRILCVCVLDEFNTIEMLTFAIHRKIAYHNYCVDSISIGRHFFLSKKCDVFLY